MPFGYATAAQWLASRAHEYGFVLAYPSGQEADTGYEWEPWHYRYVGIENAERITQGGLSLQDFWSAKESCPTAKVPCGPYSLCSRSS